ncbi:MAG: hypothetical protein LBH12_06825 [Dysgonamonadaceae bacterium]|jgi:hypothetical protein|nr:hypothetical protein [Dysgonamonadaceae bacterium]
MKKEKFVLEFVFDRGSINNLWTRLATPGGLAEWFADEVIEAGNMYSFYWDGYPSEAELVGTIPLTYIRFHWVEDTPDTYFEFRLHKDELTGGIMLEITDFAEPDEKEHSITLWETQVKDLRRKLGI